LRHDRIFLPPAGWDAILDAAPLLGCDPDITRWREAGWPLVRRRRLPGEQAVGVPLGLALPPASGKRRVGVMALSATIGTVSPALDLAEARAAAPISWQPTIDAILTAARQQGQRVQVFGSLAWAAMTTLPYLTPHSDLDLMLALLSREALDPFLEALDTIAQHAPMRLDGEIVRADGAALQWREVWGSEALVKHEHGVSLMAPAAFLAGCAP
jgi:phosphoribosyl-dephospho-CoA transferase